MVPISNYAKSSFLSLSSLGSENPLSSLSSPLKKQLPDIIFAVRFSMKAEEKFSLIIFCRDFLG